MARKYEFYVLVARAISHSFASLTREIMFLPLEHKIHIFSPPCNILYIFLYRFGRTQLPSNSKAACKQNHHKPGPVAFNSGRLRGQEMLLAVNFEGKNIFYRKWMWSWTISFKITAEIEVRKHMFCLTSQTSCIGSVGKMFFHCHEMRLHCFFTVNSRPVVFLKYIFEFVFNTDRSR